MNIGSKIEEVLKTRNIGVTDFAKRLNTSRSNIYSIFRRSSIDTNQLLAISEVLDYNFFASLSNDIVSKKVLKTPFPELECIEESLPAYKSMAHELEMLQTRQLLLEEEIKGLKSRVRDKDEIIALLKGVPH